MTAWPRSVCWRASQLKQLTIRFRLPCFLNKCWVHWVDSVWIQKISDRNLQRSPVWACWQRLPRLRKPASTRLAKCPCHRATVSPPRRLRENRQLSRWNQTLIGSGTHSNRDVLGELRRRGYFEEGLDQDGNGELTSDEFGPVVAAGKADLEVDFETK